MPFVTDLENNGNTESLQRSSILITSHCLQNC